MTLPSRMSQADKHSLLANIAFLYYGEGLTQGDIAKRLNVSRTSVVYLLQEARDQGVFEIRVSGKALSASTDAILLRQKFGLVDVYVSRTKNKSATCNEQENLRQLGRIGGVAIREILQDGEKIGVAWGLPIHAIAEQMPESPKRNVQVHQMIGSLISHSSPASEKCTIDIARKLHAQCYTLHAPAIASTPEVARIIKGEPTVTAQLANLKDLDFVVCSIGHTGVDTPMMVESMLLKSELEQARAAGAVGILCCRFIDRDGNPLSLPPHDRLLSAELVDVKQTKKRLLVAAGANRLEATLAAIKGGFATHLCIDEELANALVQHDQ